MRNIKRHLIAVANLPSLNSGEFDSSSQNYEIALLTALSKSADKVSVVSQRAKSVETFGNIILYPIENGGAVFTSYHKGIEKFSLLDDNFENVILFWGYNPVTVTELLKYKNKARLYSVIYDGHTAASEGRSPIKKRMINSFFEYGLKKINKINGVILFRQEAVGVLRLRVPYLVSAPFVSPKDIIPYKRTENDRLRFTYAGSLCAYNSIRNIVDAMSLVPKADITMDFYGEGGESEYVISASKNDRRIRYCGKLAHDELMSELESSDVLLSVRDINNDINKTAFPSKVIEYMSLGKPVMSTPVSDTEKFRDAVFLLRDNSPQEIAEMIGEICGAPDMLKAKADASFEFLTEYHNEKIIIPEISDFLFGCDRKDNI